MTSVANSLIPRALFLSNKALQLCRHKSTSYLKPHPRKHMRRLYEAALAPILPRHMEEEKRILEENSLFSFYKRPREDPIELSGVEEALLKKTIAWIEQEQFSLMAICKLHTIGEQEFWLMRNQFRLNGVQMVADISPKIWRRIFERTPLATLQNAILPRICFTFARDLETIKALFTQSRKYENFIVPLVVVYGSRILTMDQAKELSALASLEDIRAETTQILDRVTHQLVQTLSSQTTQLIHTLDAVAANKKGSAEESSHNS